MTSTGKFPEQDKFTLRFKDRSLEHAFQSTYDESVRLPLRQGIIISILSWYAAVGLIYYIIPETAYWFVPLTLVFIGSYFGFIVYATYRKSFVGYYHLMGAISNAWAGLYAIYFCHQFPNGVHLTLPVLIFIIFFGSYMVRLRWLAGSMAALTYTLGYCLYVFLFSDLNFAQQALYVFVICMTFVFAIIAGRMVETNSRMSFVQRRIIEKQNEIIHKEKQVLLHEVHHRVKNNLQIISSLINLELSKRRESKPDAALKNIQGRVMAMSLVHMWENQSSNFDRIYLKSYVEKLIANSKLQREIMDPPSYQLHIDEVAAVDIETAIPLGIILHEIINNFFDHCEAEQERSFQLQLHKNDHNLFSLVYKDNGPGFPENTSLESENHLGLELIQTLTEQLDGEFSFHNKDGAVYELSFITENT